MKPFDPMLFHICFVKRGLARAVLDEVERAGLLPERYRVALHACVRLLRLSWV
jgi:hypothetical protein